MSVKYALVKLEGTTRQYCFWTILTDLDRGSKVLVDTANGMLLGEFIKYTTEPRTVEHANRWVFKAVDRKTLRRYLQAELEECGIDYNQPVRQNRYSEAKKMVEESRDRDAIERLIESSQSTEAVEYWRKINSRQASQVCHSVWGGDVVGSNPTRETNYARYPTRRPDGI